ncbi:MAG: toll/interleukin-1 receptor domain-containing protein [Betaproteobacteria bacterium]|nr:toll/interleukin-1 receptor domain-containing protein [Betaproteobacteria bacterium]MCL2885252.1 toll/interleukin-1 receptor domain-containing protein [Betaproteobacteria bacterium]
MTHDIFVSYSTRDKLFADALVHRLEKAGYRCWYAPRDIAAGVAWPQAISQAIREIPLMLLVFSGASNSSDEISRELTLASSNKRIVLPVRIENVLPGAGLEYHLADRHWLDVFGLEEEAAINRVLEGLASYAPIFAAARPDETPAPAPAAPSPDSPSRSRGLWILLASLLLILLVGALAFWFERAPDDTDALSLHEPPSLVHYVNDNLSIAAHTLRLNPSPDSPLPQYLVTLTGIGEPFDGHIFLCQQREKNNTLRFDATIDDRSFVLLIVDHRGRGMIYQPGSAREYPVLLSPRDNNAASARHMLKMYRQGKRWTE